MYKDKRLYKELHSVLTDREEKGFLFENEIHNILTINGYEYRGTPKNPTLWKRDITKGADFNLKWNIELESKYSDAKIFPSWIKRDWIPRFSNECYYKIVVCNQTLKDKLPNSSIELLREANITLVVITHLAYYLRKLFRDIEHRVTNLLEVDEERRIKYANTLDFKRKVIIAGINVRKLLISMVKSMWNKLKIVIKEGYAQPYPTWDKHNKKSVPALEQDKKIVTRGKRTVNLLNSYIKSISSKLTSLIKEGYAKLNKNLTHVKDTYRILRTVFTNNKNIMKILILLICTVQK